MVFKKANPNAAGLAFYQALDPFYSTAIDGTNSPLIDGALTALAAATRFAEAMLWKQKGDPLVLDLRGDGLDTTSLSGSGVHFDLNTDYFAERTGWIAASDGFLVLDKNGNGAIDDASEMFGSFTGSGFADLAAYDSNHDGRIDASDLIFSKLKVWQDANQDGVAQPGELHSLADEGIASISLNAIALDGTTVEGASLRAAASFTRTDGTSSGIYEAIFQTDQTDTVYRGTGALAAWQSVGASGALDVHGFGRVTNLSVAMAA